MKLFGDDPSEDLLTDEEIREGKINWVEKEDEETHGYVTGNYSPREQARQCDHVGWEQSHRLICLSYLSLRDFPP